MFWIGAISATLVAAVVLISLLVLTAQLFINTSKVVTLTVLKYISYVGVMIACASFVFILTAGSAPGIYYLISTIAAVLITYSIRLNPAMAQALCVIACGLVPTAIFSITSYIFSPLRTDLSNAIACVAIIIFWVVLAATKLDVIDTVRDRGEILVSCLFVFIFSVAIGFLLLWGTFLKLHGWKMITVIAAVVLMVVIPIALTWIFYYILTVEPKQPEAGPEQEEQYSDDDHWYRGGGAGQWSANSGGGTWMTEQVKIALARLHIDQIVKDEESFTMDVINDAYKKEIKKWHPDVDPEGTEVSKQLNDAYDLLRKTYEALHSTRR